MARFDPSLFLPERMISRLTDVRVTDPDRVLRAAERRERRSRFTADGRLNIVAADHPAPRGPRAGAGWELDDPITGPTPADCAARGLDGGKLLLRLCDDEPGSLKTLVMV